MKFWHAKKEGKKISPKKFFNDNLVKTIGTIFGMFIVACLAAELIGFDFFLIFRNFGKVVARFFELYLPPNFSSLNILLEEIWVTIILAISAGTIGCFLAYFSAIGMSNKTGKNRFLKGSLRVVAGFVRNVPTPIWAIILLMAFWFGEFLALLVMTLGTYAFNARLFSDMIDETNSHSIEALEATGANYWQIIVHAVYPETLPVALSWALYAVESNIRSATIIGMLAGGGIGRLIGVYRHFRRFDELMAAVIMVVITILIFDQISIQIRKRILS